MRVFKRILLWTSLPLCLLGAVYYSQPQILWKLSNGMGIVIDPHLVRTLATRHIPHQAAADGQALQKTMILLQALQVSTKLRQIPGLPSLRQFSTCSTHWGRSVCEWNNEGRDLFLFFEMRSGLWTLVDIQGDALDHWIQRLW